MPGVNDRAPLRRAVTRVACLTLGGAATIAVAFTAPAGASSRPPAPTSLKAVTKSPASYLTWRSGPATTFVVQQATDQRFSKGLATYRMRAPGKVFTPYGLTRGKTYYYRVRAVSSGRSSRPSNTVSLTAAGAASPVRVLSYNVLSATFDGEKHPGGTAAPFSQRRSPQLALLRGSNADVIGLQEGASCLWKVPHGPCYRQVDSISKGLQSRYTLDDTTAGYNRYGGNYILYNAKLAPIGNGGTWLLGPSNEERNAAYQAFRVVSSGAQFLFVNTHLTSEAGSGYDKIRGEETVNLLRQSKAYAKSLGLTSVVYVGDFNSYVHEWHVNDISGSEMRTAGIPDGIAVAQHRVKSRYDSINQLYRSARKGHGSSDHIYATGGVAVRTWHELMNIENGRFVGTIPSDHNPLSADVTIPF